MDGSTIAAWVGVGFLAISSITSSIVAIVKTSKERSKFNGRIEEKLKNLEDSSSNLSRGVSVISRDIGKMKEHCAGVTSKFSTQIASLQKEVNSKKED
jgi:hypothetical protein